ncbi:MAG: phage tail protein I [Clostridia bacterium]|nr:phage tail protein I [Clostridia bacterium]
MNDNFGTDVLLSSFPPSLAVDADKYALARVIAEELRALLGDCDKLRIYSRIDELDEELLDILAFDFAVSWYYYNGSIEIKRAQIKSCFYVHRHLGTKNSLVTALCDLCPGSNVEEWFEYGGEPYYFRIVIDVTEQRLPIVQSDVERYIEIFKSLRSVLESNKVIYRTRDTIEMSISDEYFIYGAPKSSEHTEVRAGVYPENTLLCTRD